MLFFFLYPWLPQFWQHKALLPPHKRTHTHKQCFLFHMSKCEALPGLSTIASVTLLFFPLCRQAESVLTALLLIFIFLQNFNYFVLHLSCLSIVSMPITTRSCVVLHPGSQILTFPFTNTCVPLCFPQGMHAVFTCLTGRSTLYRRHNTHKTSLWRFLFLLTCR